MSELRHLLRIYVDADAISSGQAYWRVLLDQARTGRIKSAAALGLLDAFGTEGIVHGAKAAQAGPGKHVILEFLDTEPALRRFLEGLPTTDDASLATLETLSIARYGGHRHAGDEP